MSLLGTITFPINSWIWLVLGVVPVALVLLIWAYHRATRLSGIHAVAFCLKVLAMAALALCLIEPLWSGRQAKSGANLFVVVADNSSGMNVRDRDSDQSRAEVLQAALETGRSSWLARLAEDFQVRQYAFDSHLRRVTDFSTLTFDGKATALHTTLNTLAERYRDRPLAGVLLFTDGNATDMAKRSTESADLPPIYPVVIGKNRPPRDIVLAKVSVTQTSFEDAPVTVTATVEASGYAGTETSVELLEESGQTIRSKPWSIGDDDDKETFRFRFRPERTGVQFYRLRVAEVRDTEPTDDPNNVSSEATLANNERTIVVDHGKGPYRILYVAGRPNWEFKFLQRALNEDEQVGLVGLIRAARREPKYDWRGRAGEQSNPLYRGFEERQQEEAEQYDQPVLVRLNTRDAQELLGGFPQTAEDLYGYHAIILDDIEAGFFSHDQMDLMRKFVTERGGGFLMLGGTESFQRGDFEHTGIANILPVYLDRLPDATNAASVQMKLTRQGWLQPWIRLRDNEQAERQRLDEMPEFRVVNRTRLVKPGARIVATLGDGPDEEMPALVTQRLGKGRSAALTIGDIWRWGLRRPEMREDMDKFWRQTLRWLIADVPEPISILAVQDSEQANPLTVLQVRVHDKEFKPMDNASISVQVRPWGGAEVELVAEPTASESGLFEAVYAPRQSGGYFADVMVTDEKGMKLGEASTGWAVDLEAREFQSVRVDRAGLERIARQTGGRLIELDELDSFARALPHESVPVTEVWTLALWDLPGVAPLLLLFILACFVGEWALRRWKGMA